MWTLILNFTLIKPPRKNHFNANPCYQKHDKEVSSIWTLLKTLRANVLQENLKSARQEKDAGLKKKRRAERNNHLLRGERPVARIINIRKTVTCYKYGKSAKECERSKCMEAYKRTLHLSQSCQLSKGITSETLQ